MKLVASALLVALVLSGARAANAEPPPIVRVFVAGSPDVVSSVRDALQDQCAMPNLAIMVQDAASADAELLDTAHSSGLADAYVDLRPDNETRVVVVDGQTHEQLEGRTLGRAPSLDVAIETVAQVVCSVVESALAERAAAEKPTPPAAPAPAPARPLPRPVADEHVRPTWDRASTAWLGAFAVAADYGAGLRVGGGAVVGASFGASKLRLGGSLSAFGFPSLELAKEGAQASLDLYGVRLMPTLEWNEGSQWGLFAGAGVGADWLRVSAGNPPMGGVAQSDSGSIEPMLSSLIGAKLGLGQRVSARLALGADVDVARHRYLNEVSGEPTLFFESPRVRAVGLAGFAVSFDREPGAGGSTTTGSGELP